MLMPFHILAKRLCSFIPELSKVLQNFRTNIKLIKSPYQVLARAVAFADHEKFLPHGSCLECRLGMVSKVVRLR